MTYALSGPYWTSDSTPRVLFSASSSTLLNFSSSRTRRLLERYEILQISVDAMVLLTRLISLLYSVKVDEATFSVSTALHKLSSSRHVKCIVHSIYYLLHKTRALSLTSLSHDIAGCAKAHSHFPHRVRSMFSNAMATNDSSHTYSRMFLKFQSSLPFHVFKCRSTQYKFWTILIQWWLIPLAGKKEAVPTNTTRQPPGRNKQGRPLL